MSRARFSKASALPSTSVPNTTDVHIQRPKPAPLRKAGLQDIPATNVSVYGKALVSPVPSQAELHARRMNERLGIASADIPVRNSTMRGAPYTCPDLRSNPHRAGSGDAYRVPSLSTTLRKTAP